MSEYRRLYSQGGVYFFTVVTYQRKPILTESGNIQRLRKAFRKVMGSHPFILDAIVILPDHLHCIWRLTRGDSDFSTRWRLIKHFFSVGINSIISERNEKMIWQRRFWEHLLSNEKDWRQHMDYIHYNPVKHGYVERPVDWEYSTFHRLVDKGFYTSDWGNCMSDNILSMAYE